MNSLSEEKFSKFLLCLDENCNLTDRILNRHSKFNQLSESQEIFRQLVQRSNILLCQIREFIAEHHSYPFISLPLFISTRVALLDSITTFYLHYSSMNIKSLADILRKLQQPLANSFYQIYQKCKENGENIDPNEIERVKNIFPGHFENKNDTLKLIRLGKINTSDMVNEIQKADESHKHIHFQAYINYMILSNSEHFNQGSHTLLNLNEEQLLQVVLPSLKYILQGQFVSLQKIIDSEHEIIEAKSILERVYELI